VLLLCADLPYKCNSAQCFEYFLIISRLQPDDRMTPIQLEKEYRVRIDALTTEKQDRQQRLARLAGADQHLCSTLGTSPYRLFKGAVPTEEYLSDLQRHITYLEAEKVH